MISIFDQLKDELPRKRKHEEMCNINVLKAPTEFPCSCGADNMNIGINAVFEVLKRARVDKECINEIIYKWSHGSKYETMCHRQKQNCLDCDDLTDAISNEKIIKGGG